MKSLLSGLLHVFKVNIFTLVFGEDLFLLPSGVHIAGRTLAALLRSAALLVGVLAKSLLLCTSVVAVGVVVEADSEKGENKTENTPKSDGKEHDEADNKGKKTSESIEHTAKVYGWIIEERAIFVRDRPRYTEYSVLASQNAPLFAWKKLHDALMSE